MRPTLEISFPNEARCSEEDVGWVAVTGVLVHSALDCEWTSNIHENADDRVMGRLYSHGLDRQSQRGWELLQSRTGFGENAMYGPSVGPCRLRGWAFKVDWGYNEYCSLLFANGLRNNTYGHCGQHAALG